MGGGAGPADLPDDAPQVEGETQDLIDLAAETSESSDDHSDSDDSSAVALIEPTDQAQAAAEVPCLADLLTTSDFTQYLLNDPHAPMHSCRSCVQWHSRLSSSPVDFVHARWKFEYPLSPPGPFVARLRCGPRLCAHAVRSSLSIHRSLNGVPVQVRVPLARPRRARPFPGKSQLQAGWCPDLVLQSSAGGTLCLSAAAV